MSRPDAILEDGTMIDFKLARPVGNRITTQNVKYDPIEFARMLSFDVCGSVSPGLFPHHDAVYKRLK